MDDHSTWGGGGGGGGGGFMVFCFVQKIFFGHNKLEYFFFFTRKEFNIRLYDKNSESDYFFSLHQNQNIFYSKIGNQNIFFRKKTITPPPPFKLNGRSLKEALATILTKKIICFGNW